MVLFNDWTGQFKTDRHFHCIPNRSTLQWQKSRTESEIRRYATESSASNMGAPFTNFIPGSSITSYLKYLQELPSLRKAHGIVATLKLWIFRKLVTHLLDLIIDIHEEAVLHVLRKNEKLMKSGQPAVGASMDWLPGQGRKPIQKGLIDLPTRQIEKQVYQEPPILVARCSLQIQDYSASAHQVHGSNNGRRGLPFSHRSAS